MPRVYSCALSSQNRHKDEYSQSSHLTTLPVQAAERKRVGADRGGLAGAESRDADAGALHAVEFALFANCRVPTAPSSRPAGTAPVAARVFQVERSAGPGAESARRWARCTVLFISATAAGRNSLCAAEMPPPITTSAVEQRDGQRHDVARHLAHPTERLHGGGSMTGSAAFSDLENHLRLRRVVEPQAGLFGVHAADGADGGALLGIHVELRACGASARSRRRRSCRR